MKNRDQRWAVLLSGVVLSVLLPLLVMHLPLFRELKAVDLFSYGLGMGIALATILAILNEVRSAETREHADEMKRALDSLELRVLEGRNVIASLVDREGFYRQMQQFVDEATRRIDLMYQAPKP